MEAAGWFSCIFISVTAVLMFSVCVCVCIEPLLLLRGGNICYSFISLLSIPIQGDYFAGLSLSDC